LPRSSSELVEKEVGVRGRDSDSGEVAARRGPPDIERDILDRYGSESIGVPLLPGFEIVQRTRRIEARHLN